MTARPTFKRVKAEVTGVPDSDPSVEAAAIQAFRDTESLLDRHFNNHTTLNKARGIVEALGMEIPVPPRARSKISDAEIEGREHGMVYVLASKLMGNTGPRYLARIRELLIPVVLRRIEMQAQTAEWDRRRRRVGRH